MANGQMMPQGGGGEMPMQQGGGSQGGAPSAGEIIANVDTLLGVLAEAIVSGPAPDEIKQRMAALQEEFRAIMTDLSAASKGGGGGSRPQGGGAQPMRDQGMPMGSY